MEFQQLQIVAGTVSSMMFVAGTFPMLFKSFMTKDLGSYSLENIALSNLGNLIHWVYIASLPPGPIWFLHGFITITTVLMFIGYLRYERGGSFSAMVEQLNTLIISRKERSQYRILLPTPTATGPPDSSITACQKITAN